MPQPPIPIFPISSASAISVRLQPIRSAASTAAPTSIQYGRVSGPRPMVYGVYLPTDGRELLHSQTWGGGDVLDSITNHAMTTEFIPRSPPYSMTCPSHTPRLATDPS